MNALLLPDANQRIADWFFVAFAPPLHGQTRWLVRCACGAERERYAADINAGRSSRCEACARDWPLLEMRRKARSVRCEVCKAHPQKPCRDVANAAFEWGVHVQRARLAGCPPFPSVAELNRMENSG